jgi:hypothetical protein
MTKGEGGDYDIPSGKSGVEIRKIETTGLTDFKAQSNTLTAIFDGDKSLTIKFYQKIDNITVVLSHS